MKVKQILDSSNSSVIVRSDLRVDGSYLELRSTTFGDPSFVTTHLQLAFTNGSTPIMWAKSDFFLSVFISFHALFRKVFENLTTVEAEQTLVDSSFLKCLKNADFNDVRLMNEISYSVTSTKERFPFVEALLFVDHYNKNNSTGGKGNGFFWSHGKNISQQVIDTPQKAAMALDVHNMRYGWDNYWIAKSFGPVYGYDKLLDPDYRTHVHSSYSVLSYPDNSLDDVLVKDFPLLELKNVVLDESLIQRTMDFPHGSMIYRKFLQGITAGNLKTLCGMIGKDINAETAVRISEKILASHHVRPDTDEVALDLVDFLDSRVIDKTFCQEMPHLVLRNPEQFETRLLLRDFFGNNEKIFDNVEEVKEIIDLFLNPKTTKLWAGNPRNSNLIVWVLSQKLTFDEMRRMLKSASDSEEKINLSFWLNLSEVDNIEQFGVVPVSWWKSLI